MNLYFLLLFKKQKNIFIFLFKFIVFLDNIAPCLLDTCSISQPFKRYGTCSSSGCSTAEYQSGQCYIDNEIIKTQRITNIIKFTVGGASYANLGTTPKGDLVCLSSFFETNTKKYFYGIKSNGRPYFNKNNIETSFNEIDVHITGNEGNIYGIQLKDDDKEYIVSFGSNEAYFEIYDFDDNNKVYKQAGTSFFGTGYNNFYYASMLKLNNDVNYYILGYIAQDSSTSRNFYLMKVLFNNLNIGTTNNPTKTSINLPSAVTVSSSCFLSENDYIICFYLDNSNKYKITAFNEDLDNLGSTLITSTYFSQKDFYKCVHFTGDAGAFIYLDTDSNIAIQFKKFISGTFYDCFNSNPKIKINKNDYEIDCKTADMVRLGDKKICAAFIPSDYEEFNLYVINNYSAEKIKIRHYNIQVFNFFNFYVVQEVNLDLYNDFLSIACNIYDSTSASYGAFFIFSYANSTDFSIDITDNLISFSNPIIKFYEKCNIENNIFGYIFEGFQIYNFSEGINLLRYDNQEEILKEDILPNNTDIELKINGNIKLEENSRIEYRMVTIEPEYEIYNQYPVETIKSYCGSVCDDDVDDYNAQKHSHFGRLSYLDISFDLNQISDDCADNCAICKHNDKTCIICKYSSILFPNGTLNCLAENGLTTTIITTIPTTIITTIPKREISNSVELTEITNKPNSEITNLIIQTETEKVTNKKDEENKKDTKYCTNEEILNNKCTDGEMTLEHIEYIKKTLINTNYTKENTIIKTKNIIVQLSTLEEQKDSDDPDLSNIDFGECENKSKLANNITLDDSLIIFKVDVKKEDNTTKYVTYEVYNPYTLKKLKLDVCDNNQINIKVPVILEDNIESIINSLSNSGYNIFNENDSFYNDICSTFTSNNGTDILLSDRKKDFYDLGQNQSICQSGCEIESYNSTSKKASCNCSINTVGITKLEDDNIFDKKVMQEKFYTTLKNSNFRVLKCYKLIINFSKLFNNYGEILMTIFFLIFIILMIIYFINGRKQILNYINNIIKVKNNDNNNIDDNKRKVNKNNKNKIEKHKENKKSNFFKKNKIKIKTAKNKIEITKLDGRDKGAPPKKEKLESKNQKKKNDSQCINIKNKKDEKTITNHNINNNILFNVQVLNTDKKNKGKTKDILHNIRNNKSNKKSSEKSKSKISEEVVLYSNTKRPLNFHTNEVIINNKNFNKKKVCDNKFINFNDQELNNLEYTNAIKYDKRTYFQYYWSLLKKKQLILFTFIPTNDYNITYIKIALFIVSFSLYFTINGFFFSDETMHKVYKDNGAYDIIYRIPQIFYSSVISAIINLILKQLSLSERNILRLKRDKDVRDAAKKSKAINSCLKIKFIMFFILGSILMVFFWYFISCFCAVYINTQLILIKDTLISFFTSMLYPFGLNLIPGILRISAIRAKNKDKQCIYKASLLIALI